MLGKVALPPRQVTQRSKAWRHEPQEKTIRALSDQGAHDGTERPFRKAQAPMKPLENLLSFLAGCCLLVLLAVVFADVMMRNLFNNPLIWATDLTELGMGFMAFAAMPLLSLRLRHIGIDLLPLAEHSFGLHLVNLVVCVFTGGVFLVVAWQFRVFALRTARTGEFLPQLGLQWTYVWWALCVLAFVTVAASLIAALVQARNLIRATGPRP